jgi:tripartite-type tricarboxylate transporter receptor subunit TctC
MKMFKSGAFLATITLALLGFGPAHAADFPSKAINLVVGFSAGGGTDTYARNLAATLPKYLNDQPIVVVNKSGGAQIPAMKSVQSAKADGYSAMLVSLGSAIIATGLRDRGVDLFKDFEMVAQIGVNNVMVAASLDSGFKTPQDVIAGIKKAHAAGNKLRWGNAGRASITSIAVIAWLNKNGVYGMVQDIPFKGGSKVRAALIGNNIDFGGLALSNAAGGYDKQLSVIGSFSDRRDPALPQFPTLGDHNTPYVPMETPLVFSVPKGTPKEVIALLQDAIEKSTKDPEFMARAKKSGQAVTYRNAADVSTFAAKLKSEWSETIALVRKKIAESQ